MSLRTELQQAVPNMVRCCFHFSHFCRDTFSWKHWNSYTHLSHYKNRPLEDGFTIVRAHYITNSKRKHIKMYLNKINHSHFLQLQGCDYRIVTHSVSSSFSLIPDRLVMRLRMKMAMPIEMWIGFRRSLKAKGVQGNKKAQRPTNHYPIRGERHRRPYQA